MLIEAKGPTAVIPMDEYERLKRIEDKYQDDLTVYKQRAKKTLKDFIDKIVGNPEETVVLVTHTQMAGRFLNFMDNERLNKFIEKGKVSIANEDKELFKLALYKELDSIWK